MRQTHAVELCWHCGQPMLRDATSPPAAAHVNCEFCDKEAAFIIYRHAVCFEHRKEIQP